MDEPPGKSFDDGRQGSGFPRTVQNVVSPREDTTRSLGWQIDGIVGGELLVDSFGGTDPIFGRLPAQDVRVILRNRPSRSD